MKNQRLYNKEIEELMIKRGYTTFHITGIRYCDYKGQADEFIEEAAREKREAILMPEEANPYDPDAVVCYSRDKLIGYASIYDLEKYYALARKNGADHLTGHFCNGNPEDHLLDLSVAGTVTPDDLQEYRRESDRQKDEQYGSWPHDAIKRCLVHSRHQNDAKACLNQMTEFTLKLFDGYDPSTQEEFYSLLEFYKENSQYDISLEGQRQRWDILNCLDYLHEAHHHSDRTADADLEALLTDVISQIGGEMGRSVSYKAYTGRLTDLATRHLPSSKTAQHYLKTLPAEAFDDIRRQVQAFPHHLYHLFCVDPEEFVRTLYYARIPRKYLDPFLSGIALVTAYDLHTGACKAPGGGAEGGSGTAAAGSADGNESPEAPNFFAPQKSLQQLLRRSWFAELRTSDHYDGEWTDAFVAALMASEYGGQIVQDWSVQGLREKKSQIKGHVVGLLKDAQVLKGSYARIAREVGIAVNGKSKEKPYQTFANYMARGKKQPYADWVMQYIKEYI